MERSVVKLDPGPNSAQLQAYVRTTAIGWKAEGAQASRAASGNSNATKETDGATISAPSSTSETQDESSSRVPSTGFTTVTGKHRSVYAEEKRRYARAMHIINKSEEGRQKGVEPTAEQVTSLEWANNQVRFFKDLQSKRQPNELHNSERKGDAGDCKPSSKRNRSVEESRTAKRLRSTDAKLVMKTDSRTNKRLPSTSHQSKAVTEKLPFSEVMRQHLK
ncbi:hypothetical protein RF55_23648, partial [Lasius niger]